MFLRSLIANEVNFLLMKTFCAFYLGLWLNDDDEDDDWNLRNLNVLKYM